MGVSIYNPSPTGGGSSAPNVPDNEHFVPLEQTGGTSPGKLGDYSIDSVNRKVIYYTGDGDQNHSWGTTELVACSRA